ncbi:hypothetical protein P9112_004687 [Eukaryota sp. TZLM1-RC]
MNLTDLDSLLDGIFYDVLSRDDSGEGVVVLSAIEALVKEQGLPPSATSFFAALLSLLQNPSSHSTSKLSSILYLFSAVVTVTPDSILIKQSILTSDVLLEILKSFVEDETVIPAAISASVSFLTYLSPSLLSARSPKSLSDLLFYFLTHPSDTISSRASLLLPRLFSLDSPQPSSSLLSFIKNVSSEGSEDIIKAFGLAMQVVSDITFEVTWELINLAQNVTSPKCLGSVYSFISKAINQIDYDQSHSKQFFSKIPEILALFLSQCDSNSRSTILSMQKRSNSLMVKLGNFLSNNPNEDELTCVTKTSSLILNSFSIKSRLAWSNLLSISGKLFSICNESHKNCLIKLSQFIGKLLDDAHLYVTKNSNNQDNHDKNTDYFFNESILNVGKSTMVSLIKCFGVERVLELFPLNLLENDPLLTPRPWLVWCIGQGASNSKLSIFFDYLLPQSMTIKSRAQTIKNSVKSDNPMMKAVADLELLSFQIIETLPSLCLYCRDFKDQINNYFEFLLNCFKLKDSFYSTEMILPACKSLYNLITSSCLTFSEKESLQSVFEVNQDENFKTDDELDDSDCDDDSDDEATAQQSMLVNVDHVITSEYKKLLLPNCKQIIVTLINLLMTSSKSNQTSNQLKSETRKQLLETLYAVCFVSPVNGVLNFLSEAIKKSINHVNKMTSNDLFDLHVYTDLIHVFSLASFFRGDADLSLIEQPAVVVVNCITSLITIDDSSLRHKLFRLASFLSSLKSNKVKETVFNLTSNIDPLTVKEGEKRSYLRLLKSLCHFVNDTTILGNWAKYTVSCLCNTSSKVKKTAGDVLIEIAGIYSAQNDGIDDVIRSLLLNSEDKMSTVMALSALVAHYSSVLTPDSLNLISDYISSILTSEEKSFEFFRSVLVLIKKLLSFNRGRKLISSVLLPEVLVYFQYWYQYSSKSSKLIRFIIEKFIKRFGVEACLIAELGTFTKVIKAVDKNLRRQIRKTKEMKESSKKEEMHEGPKQIILPGTFDLLEQEEITGVQVVGNGSKKEVKSGHHDHVRVDRDRVVIDRPDKKKEDSTDLSTVIRAGKVESEVKSNRKRRHNDEGDNLKKGSAVGVDKVSVVKLTPNQLKKKTKKEDLFSGLIKGAKKGAKAKKSRRR